MRIDRWLWCARFFKTRSLAAAAVRSGNVRLEAGRVKTARDVRVGDALSIRRDGTVTDIRVLEIPVRRGPSGEAARLYRETAESLERRSARRKPAIVCEPPTPGRPDRRTRRLVREHRRMG